ncbi:hypothetical protein [Streptomyces sp. NPDC102487]|uniref:DUF7660 family protein n=1 Tax=Streptomyces sp. NPDC102487 TaxID=3366182 RepID=UPI0037F49E2E
MDEQSMRFSRRSHGAMEMRYGSLSWAGPKHPSFVLQRSHADDGSSWENADLPSFLEASAVWIDDADGWDSNIGRELPASGNWRFLVRALRAATIYE